MLTDLYDNRQARRSNTFRLAKPTLTPLMIATGAPGPGFVVSSPLPGIVPAHEIASATSPVPGEAGFSLRNVSNTAVNVSGGGGTNTTHTRSKTSTGGSRTDAPSMGGLVRAAFSTPSVTSELCAKDDRDGLDADRIARNLIGEYLSAKKTKCAVHQQQQLHHHRMSIPPPIFHVYQSTSPGHIHQQQQQQQQHQQHQQQRQIDELAYKHPILLMDTADDDEGDEKGYDNDTILCSENRLLESEDDCSIELVLQDDSKENTSFNHDLKNDVGEDTTAGNESPIVPRPKMIAFHSLKGPKEGQQQQQQQQHSSPGPATCRLVGKVNPNILKTWEQLSGQQMNSRAHPHPRQPMQRQSASTERILLLAEDSFNDGVGETIIEPAESSMRTATSTGGCLHGFDTGNEERQFDGDDESADERQSCLLYCPQQRPYHHLGSDAGDQGEREAEEEVIEFKVNKLQHHPTGVSDAPDSRTVSSGSDAAGRVGATTTVGSTSSDGIDFYDSIDAASTPLPGNAKFLLATEDGPGSYTQDLPSVFGGEGLAEFTSIDRKQLLWSIEIEQ